MTDKKMRRMKCTSQVLTRNLGNQGLGAINASLMLMDYSNKMTRSRMDICNKNTLNHLDASANKTWRRPRTRKKRWNLIMTSECLTNTTFIISKAYKVTTPKRRRIKSIVAQINCNFARNVSTTNLFESKRRTKWKNTYGSTSGKRSLTNKRLNTSTSTSQGSTSVTWMLILISFTG